MKNSSDEKYRAINSTDLQKSANNIPVEIIDKFPEYKGIIEMINQMVTEGYGVKEIEQKIMQSKEYLSLEKKQDEIHKFQDEMEGIDKEKDLKAWEEGQKYIKRIKNAANKVFMEMDLDTKGEGINENLDLECSTPVRWFGDAGYIITEKELAVELAKIGKLICLKSAFNMLDLLALLTGVAILPRADNRDIISSIIEKEDILCKYIDKFERMYRVR
jgi:hypothetical protein